ncbi:MAG: hypothetical protein GPJ54_04355 [Candidatus Heimdallarchaeota archaeon]|nr:hypothetical protein [Candidatus Heimdallarchaeota archaeon]
MKLGNGMYILQKVENLEKSSKFYNNLGFTKLEENVDLNLKAQSILYTDGHLNLMLVQGKQSSTSLLYYNEEIENEFTKFEELGFKLHAPDKSDSTELMSSEVVIKSPNGVNVVIRKDKFNEKHTVSPRENKSLLDWGKFGEFSIPVKNFEIAEKFWNMLGFTTTFKDTQPYPWGILFDEMLILGLHQTADYDNIARQSITYFHPQMDEKIRTLQQRGFTFEKFSEGSIETGQAVLTSPDGLKIFLFKGSTDGEI